MYSVKDIRIDLYLEGEEYDSFWNEYKDEFIKAIREQEKIDNDFAICLESDLQFEEEFLEEENKKLEIIKNANGLIFYKIREV